MSLPRGKPSPWKTETPMSDVPSPLHIIKRTKTVQFHHNAKRETSNGSIDYGPDQPLRVTKKRQCPGPRDQITSSAPFHEKQSTDAKSTFRMICPMPNAHCGSPAQRPPKSKAPLRWFSKQRTSSIDTTCRRYSSRSHSSSSDESSSDRLQKKNPLNEVSAMKPRKFPSVELMDASSSSMPTWAGYCDDCHLLVPRITITPEVQASDNGIYTVWAGIEISVRLSRPCVDSPSDPNLDSISLSSNPLRAGSVSRFGYIYNLQVNVLPMPQTAILEVLEDRKRREIPTLHPRSSPPFHSHHHGSLSLGSTFLVLAKVKLDCRQPQQSDRSMIPKSNELIADLESDLGLSSVKYLQVCLQYRHSGFSTSNDATPTDGTTDYQTQINTTATGIVDPRILQSPLSSSQVNAGENSLFNIVASYWGPVRANEILSRKMNQAGPVAANDTTLVDNNWAVVTSDSFTHHTATAFSPSISLSGRQADLPPSPSDRGGDPARKIWTEMRRRASHNRQAIYGTSAERLPAAAARIITGKESATISSIRMKSNVDRQREWIRDVALRNKRSIGAESLKSLVPSMINLEKSSKDAWGDSSSNASNKENVPPERRKEGRWSLAGWW